MKVELQKLVDLKLSWNQVEFMRNERWIIETPTPYNTGSLATVYVDKRCDAKESMVYLTLFLIDELGIDPLDVMVFEN